VENDRSKVARDEHLWRRIHPSHFVEAQNRVSTAAFKDPNMSVDIARLQVDKRITLQGGVGLASFTAAVAYDNGQTVVADPQEDNHAHAVVIGRKSRKVLKAFVMSSEFISRESIEAEAANSA
jgi:uncharacterized membrane protein